MQQRPVEYLLKSSPYERTFVGLIGLVIAVLLWIFADTVTSDKSHQISLFSALLSGMLSLVIAWVYLKIAEDTSRQTDLEEQVMNIQSDQVKIMQQQQELMEFQYVPRVRLRDFELLPDNQVEIKLINVGNGLAERMFLRTEIFVRPNSDSQPIYNLEDEVFKRDGREFTLRPGYTPLARSEEGIVPSNLSGETLRPDENEVTFKSRVRFGVELINEGDVYGFASFRNILDRINHMGFSDAHIELSIMYSDINGGVHTEYILGRTVNLETGDRELDEMVNTDYVTPWSPRTDEERMKLVEELDIYPPNRY